jgi:hypothetical protein
MRAVIRSTVLIAVMAAPQASFAQTGDKAYCVESQAGSRNCIYDSRELCQQAVGVRSAGGRCVTNPVQFGTTGARGMDPPRGIGPNSMDRLPAPVR